MVSSAFLQAGHVVPRKTGTSHATHHRVKILPRNGGRRFIRSRFRSRPMRLEKQREVKNSCLFEIEREPELEFDAPGAERDENIGIFPSADVELGANDRDCKAATPDR